MLRILPYKANWKRRTPNIAYNKHELLPRVRQMGDVVWVSCLRVQFLCPEGHSTIFSRALSFRGISLLVLSYVGFLPIRVAIHSTTPSTPTTSLSVASISSDEFLLLSPPVEKVRSRIE